MKIGIVNHAVPAVEAMRRTLAQRQEHEIIWIANDGRRAIELCAWRRPDLILMDLAMPLLDGIAATRHIMQHTPCAILIVSANLGADAVAARAAMDCGALDAIDAPAAWSGSNDGLLNKIDAIKKLIVQPQSAAVGAIPASPAEPAQKSETPDSSCLVAIGASAGGPAALAALLSQLPADFPAAIVVVQHVDAQFAAGMADWLGGQSTLPVRLARDGDRPLPATVLLAGTDSHLYLKQPSQLAYSAQPSSYPYRPSIDVFFQSIAHSWDAKAIGILLTGMGRDGALGLKAMRDKGYYTIAQDRRSSAVYGMPKAAAMLDAAVDVLPLECIAAKLLRALYK
ncbi:chemotaxis-specific protein-glutamate methyltransferase CheB [Paraherbaspirillum soli]|uniref:protein-glutamate methylesterase n=1 Tax=Paraherbaspirillum soli TaxID=631222 RepID=A0ABW0M9Y4_9BURK